MKAFPLHFNYVQLQQEACVPLDILTLQNRLHRIEKATENMSAVMNQTRDILGFLWRLCYIKNPNFFFFSTQILLLKHSQPYTQMFFLFSTQKVYIFFQSKFWRSNLPLAELSHFPKVLGCDTILTWLWGMVLSECCFCPDPDPWSGTCHLWSIKGFDLEMEKMQSIITTEIGKYINFLWSHCITEN